MKKPNFTKLIKVFNSEKLHAIMILIVGMFTVYFFSFLNSSVAYFFDSSDADKKILNEQESTTVPEVSEGDGGQCYECGAGDVEGVTSDSCNGVSIPVTDDNVCTTADFDLYDSVSGSEDSIGDTITVLKNETITLYSLDYPVYWNGHNKFVGGVTDNTIDWYTGEWTPISFESSSGSNVAVKDGTPLVDGNNYGSIYEAPDTAVDAVYGTSDGASRSELKYEITPVDAEQPTNKGKKQSWYTVELTNTNPGSDLFSTEGWANPNYSKNTLEKRIIAGNEPYPTTTSEFTALLYGDERTSCNDYSNVNVVIGTSDETCINNNGFFGWGGIWDIQIKIKEACVRAGLCKGYTDVTIVLNMEEFTLYGIKVALEARTNPGDNNSNGYVATTATFQRQSGDLFQGIAVWPDYLYLDWKSSELGSSLCDPEQNYATVITDNGPVTFNLCEYYGGFGFFSYVQYVTKRCDCVINGNCEAISDDESRSCSLMITGQG